jgi:hypothetical protein
MSAGATCFASAEECFSDPDIASALVNGGLKDAESAPLPGSM